MHNIYMWNWNFSPSRSARFQQGWLWVTNNTSRSRIKLMISCTRRVCEPITISIFAQSSIIHMMADVWNHILLLLNSTLWLHHTWWGHTTALTSSHCLWGCVHDDNLTTTTTTPLNYRCIYRPHPWHSGCSPFQPQIEANQWHVLPEIPFHIFGQTRAFPNTHSAKTSRRRVYMCIYIYSQQFHCVLTSTHTHTHISVGGRKSTTGRDEISEWRLKTAANNCWRFH